MDGDPGYDDSSEQSRVRAFRERVYTLRVVFEPPDLDRPGRLPHQQGLFEARLGCEDESTQFGAPGPESLVFGGCAFLPFSLGPPGDCSWRH